MLPGNVKENDPAVAWHGLQRMLNHPNNGGRRLLARVSVTGLEVPVMRIPYRSGFLPTGPCGVATAAKEGGQIPCREPVLDGRGSGSSGHSQAMAGSSG